MYVQYKNNKFSNRMDFNLHLFSIFITTLMSLGSLLSNIENIILVFN